MFLWSRSLRFSLVACVIASSVCLLTAQVPTPPTNLQVHADGPGPVVPVIFSTSFTTAQGWLADYTQDATCGGAGLQGHQANVSKSGDWNAAPGVPTGCDRVITTGNHSSGSGGRGFTHKVANGTNNSGGEVTIAIPGSPRKLWIRYYMRLQAGLAIASGGSPHKMIYFSGARCNGNSGGCYLGMSAGETRFTVAGLNYQASNTGGANDVDFRDNQWHRVEVKVDATAGDVEVRVDGVIYLNETAVSFGGSGAGFSEFEWPSNGEFNAASNPLNEDLDDLAISVVDWIGPYNSSRGY